jgi:hypothetical protein
MRIFRPAVGVLLLALTLAAPGAFASPARATVSAPKGGADRGNLLDPLRAFLVRLWKPEGCRLDPWGRCLQGARTAVPRPPAPEAGCEFDPWGRCIIQP